MHAMSYFFLGRSVFVITASRISAWTSSTMPNSLRNPVINSSVAYCSKPELSGAVPHELPAVSLVEFIDQS